MKKLIYIEDAIAALDKHLRETDVPVSYPGIISALTEWLNELPSAEPDSKELSSTHKALDTISRQAAVEAIKTWGLIDGLSEGQAIEILEDEEKLSPAEPEIIRCKNCRHNHDCDIQYHAQAGEEFYCGAAKRRTDGEEVH